MAKVTNLNDFQQGVFYAAGLLVEWLDNPVAAADILKEAGLLEADVAELDETEQLAMKKLMEQEPSRAKFTGFTV